MSPVPDDICNIKMMMPIIATHFLNKTKFTLYTENIYKIIRLQKETVNMPDYFF